MDTLVEKQTEEQMKEAVRQSLLERIKQRFRKTPAPETDIPPEETIVEQQEEAVSTETAEEPQQEETPATMEQEPPVEEDSAPERSPVELLEEDEDDFMEDMGLSDPGDVGELKLEELDEEPNLEEDEESMEAPAEPEVLSEELQPEEPEIPLEPEETPAASEAEVEAEEKKEEEPQPESEEPLAVPPEEEAPAAEQEPEITPAEQETSETESQPQLPPEETKKEPEEEPEKYTLTTWWADNCYRCFAVFITGILLTMTLAIHSDLLLSVLVYELGEEKPTLSKVSIEHDLDQLLADAGFEWQEGDGYRWSGYGEDHRATLTYCPAFTVNIHGKLDGEESFTTNGVIEKSLRQMLEERGYTFGEQDYTEPELSAVPIRDVDVTVYRVEVREYESTKVIPFETIYQETSLFYRNKNRQLKTVTGKDGEAKIAVHERYLDGEMVEYEEEILETISEPVNEVIKVYGERAPVSDMEGPAVVDGRPEGWKLVLTGRATGYSAGRTYRRVKGASGMWLTYGYVAVNPKQIPYGTKLYIESVDGNFVYGYCIAADTGIALMEGVIAVDLFYDTYTESAINAVWNVNIYAEP